jgi:hypothetical protein
VLVVCSAPRTNQVHGSLNPKDVRKASGYKKKEEKSAN